MKKLIYNILGIKFVIFRILNQENNHNYKFKNNKIKELTNYLNSITNYYKKVKYYRNKLKN